MMNKCYNFSFTMLQTWKNDQKQITFGRMTRRNQPTFPWDEHTKALKEEKVKESTAIPWRKGGRVFQLWRQLLNSVWWHCVDYVFFLVFFSFSAPPPPTKFTILALSLMICSSTFWESVTVRPCITILSQFVVET